MMLWFMDCTFQRQYEEYPAYKPCFWKSALWTVDFKEKVPLIGTMTVQFYKYVDDPAMAVSYEAYPLAGIMKGSFLSDIKTIIRV